MKKIYLLFILLNFTVFAQQTENYKFSDTLKNFTSNYFIEFFKPYEKGIIFFYPNDDSLKKIDFDIQVKIIAKDTRFKNAKIIGVPYKTGIKDDDNVYFEKHVVTNTEFFVYSKDSLSVNKALKNETNFTKKTKQMPIDFYLIDISKESICVKEKRIEFCKSFILEFLDPTLTQNEKIDDLSKRLLILEELTNKIINENLEKDELIDRQTERIEDLEIDLQNIKLNNK